ncbi:hypothetical protein TWF696_001183 [Orbilia brochopaga]|uniref:LysM domain-containing protein n=1 Tax=Orbilia brochopaga TaxID=3140254 RepID=A0AAV9U7Y1_9PEZI
MASEEIASRQQRPGKARLQSPYQGTSRYLNRNSVTREWGPTGAHASSEEPRKQNLRAALLTNDAATASETRKRRSSLSSDTRATGRGSECDDVLVYVHNVQPTDTLARVLLIYDIDPEALRKANRLWPNDNIQMRSQLYLPVNDCAVKGIPLSTRDASGNFVVPKKFSETKQATLLQSNESEVGSSSQSTTNLRESKGHHSFIHIDPIGPVEIVRLPKPKLSHFPPATNDHPAPDPRLDDSGETQEVEFPHLIGDLAKESLEGLEVVGAAIETFVRKVTRIAWVNKTTNDLIELTSQIGGRVQSSDDKKGNSNSKRREFKAHRPEGTRVTSATTNSVAVRGDGSEVPRNRRRTRRSGEPDT